MEAIFTKGVEVINISGLMQWDVGQEVKISFPSMPATFQVHFGHKKAKEAYAVEAITQNGSATVQIPNILLQQSQDIIAWVYVSSGMCCETTHIINFDVEARPRPSDYAYKETDILNYATVVEKSQEIAAIAARAEVAEACNETLNSAKSYTDTEIADLVNAAPEELNTLKELADAMLEHEDVVEALNSAIGMKANQTDLTAHTNNADIHVTASDKTNWNNATDKINNLKVGGRNLVLKSLISGQNAQAIDGKMHINITNVDTFFYLVAATDIEAGEYTLSFDCEGVPESVQEGALLWTWSIKNTTFNIKLSNGKVIVTGEINDNYAAGTAILIDDVMRNYITLYEGTIILSNFKLEKGNVATDWTPAPEDNIVSLKTIDVDASYFYNMSTQETGNMYYDSDSKKADIYISETFFTTYRIDASKVLAFAFKAVSPTGNSAIDTQSNSKNFAWDPFNSLIQNNNGNFYSWVMEVDKSGVSSDVSTSYTPRNFKMLYMA